MTRRFELIVFDWDGTLLDSQEHIVGTLFATCADLAITPPTREAAKDIIGLGLPEALEKLFPGTGPEERLRITDTYRRHFLGKPSPSKLFPGVMETLHRLHTQGYLLGIATGKGRRGLDRSLEEFGLSELFHATRCADEAFSKPHPQMLLDLLEMLGVAAANTLMVGDTEYDMQMANNADTASLAVDYGVHDKQRLMRHNPLGCINAIGEIQQWLDH
jgi:phosphoglycolate phosphatase